MTRDRISFTEIADRMGIARATARRLVRDGTIPGGELLYRSVKSGRERWKISRLAFEEWFTQRAAVPN